MTISVVREGDRLTLRAPRLHVEVTAGPERGRAAVLDGPVATVGSGKDCNLVIADATVSRHHATLRLEARGVRVVDPGSRNGVRIDGVEVIDGFAHDGAAIALGQTTLRLGLAVETVDVPLHPDDHLGGLVGTSVAMRRLFALITRIAPTDVTVLIEGETGTGKELVAEALHERSARAGGPFVVLDCSAATGALIESELFGHVRGAFTGAVADRVGAFAAADGGTLFLDEIGELPLELQPKLLRALEARQVRRLGDPALRAVDVRVIAATHRDLTAMIERGGFREDLYYRLAVVRLETPPLRERREDVPLLAAHFARRLAARYPGAPPLDARALRRLAAGPLAGNVRELRNQLERLIVIGDAGGAPPAPVAPPPPIDLDRPYKEARDEVLAAFEAAYVAAALAESGGNVSAAARRAGVTRKFIHHAINTHGLREPSAD